MKIKFTRTLLTLSSVCAITASYALPPRVSLWGLAGSDILARGDIMLPLFGNNAQILWADTQAKYGEQGSSMGSLGAGYRQVYHNQQVLGLYGFIDYNTSIRGNHFWVASPGVESLGCQWDFRLNGYFPVSRRFKKIDSVFASGLGEHEHVFFSGHQQFDRLFSRIEEIGNGVDGEIGRTVPILANPRVYLGGYYFNLHTKNSFDFSHSSVGGVSGRLEYPLRPHVVFQLIDTYDNLAHNTALVGLQINLGGCTSSCKIWPTEPQERILDPVSRNLSTQSVGNGTPVVTAKRVEGESALVRDNIYFFTSTGGHAFNAASGTANGTYENPLAGASFNQLTVDALNVLAPNTNFYFTPGTYRFSSVDPNFALSLHTGQSMWGRTSDYAQPAEGNERPLFLGEINLGLNFAAGNNRLDSIRLLDARTNDLSISGDVDMRVIDIANAENVVLFNDDIRGTTLVVSDLGANRSNLVSGIYANNSQVVIKDTTIFVRASVTRDNFGLNYATAIGGNSTLRDADFTNNDFTIINSSLTGEAEVQRHQGFVGGANNLIENFGAAIGGASAFSRHSNFLDNNFTVKNSALNGSATVGGNNYFANFATGIGGNNNAGDILFADNLFVLLNNRIEATAIVHGNNLSDGLGSGQNSATGIGGNSIYQGTANFVSNDFFISNTDIIATALLVGNNTTPASANYATGIGGNASNNINSATARFIDNNFTLLLTRINSSASIQGENSGLNFDAGIGGNSSPLDDTLASFTGNTFNISQLTLNALSSVSSSGMSRAFGINFDLNNNLGNVRFSSIHVLGLGPTTSTVGLIASGVGDVINAFDTTLTVRAPSGFISCTLGNVNLVNSTCNP